MRGTTTLWLTMSALGGFAFMLPGSAGAASFDCAKAAAPIEKIICYEPSLSKLDETLAQEFRDKRLSLGNDAATKLLDDQRAWLSRRTKTCPVPKTIGPKISSAEGDEIALEAAGCLIDLYRDRIAWLHIKPIELLYSANDNLCKPLVRALNRHHEKHPREFSFLRAFPDLSRDAGITEPNYISEDGSPTSRPDNLYASPVFFRADVAGDGVKRLVYMNYANRGTLGTYQSEVSILRPGVIFRKNKYGVKGQIREDVDADIVDLRIDNFREPPTHHMFPGIRVTYASGRIVFPITPEPSAEAVDRLRNSYCGFSCDRHDAILHGWHLYFASSNNFFEEFGGIYSVTPDMKIKVACITNGARTEGRRQQ